MVLNKADSCRLMKAAGVRLPLFARLMLHSHPLLLQAFHLIKIPSLQDTSTTSELQTEHQKGNVLLKMWIM